MLINCKSCQKKFTLPDSAITESGRLLQCGSCGNKWMQYLIKKNPLEEIKKIPQDKIKQPNNVNKIKTSLKKKKREINLYSKEYLDKKYGLKIEDSPNHQNQKQIIHKKMKSNFGFYNYFLTISIFIVALVGVLNLSNELIVKNYPLAIPYVNYFYEVIDIVKIKILNL
jgi:predicted Zn finger-like uncharacterized protein